MNSKHENVRNSKYYAYVNGQKIPLTDAQGKAWYEMINGNRRYARNFGTCGQSDYRKCNGDCCRCPYVREGAFLYMDDQERYGEGVAFGPLAPAEAVATPEERAVEEETWRWLYREADKQEKRGKEILFLSLEEGLSAHQIAERTGMAKSTVVDRLNRLLDFIRQHREELI